MKTLPVALQLYTVRDFLAEDLEGTLRKVKAMGYDYVEPAGYFPVSGEELKKLYKEIGLTQICSHIPLTDLIEDPDRAIREMKAVDCKYIAVPYLTEEWRPGTEGFAKTVEVIRDFGTKCRDNGITLLYHNHDFEFANEVEGKFALDYMYDTIPADILQTELDTCWVRVAGQSPDGYVRKYANRCPVVHLKDYVGEKSENMYALIGIDEGEKKESKKFAFRPVGYGVQDIPAILQAALESGADYVVVEQDQSDDCTSLEAAAKSREYLRSLGW